MRLFRKTETPRTSSVKFAIVGDVPKRAVAGSAGVLLNNKIYFVGGRNKDDTASSMVVYDLDKKSFVKASSKDYPKRTLCTAVVIGDSIVLFGGRANSYMNDVHTYSGGKWTEVEVADPKPSPRYGHTACVVGSYMYVFGGYDSDGDTQKDFWRFNSKKNTWRKLKEGPPARQLHTMVACGSCIYVFGGKGGTSGTYYNDIHVYDTKAKTWECVSPQTDKPKNKLPIARSAHASWITESKFYVFGGLRKGKQEKDFDDLWAFDLDNASWECVSVQGDVPKPIAYHSVVTGDNLWFMFGGTNLKDEIVGVLYKQEITSCFATKVPDEIWMNIFSNLTKSEYFCISLTCKQFSIVVKDDALWEPIYYKLLHSKKKTKDTYWESLRAIFEMVELPPPGEHVWRNVEMWAKSFKK